VIALVEATVSDRLVVASCQLDLAVGEVARNRRAGREAVVAAAAKGARLVVLPELTPSGYVFASLDEARSLAEPLDGETVSEWSALAAEHDVVIVGGLCERHVDGMPRNTSVVVDRTGLRTAYRKVHLWGDEPDFFTPGDQLPEVVDVGDARIATMVCYDLEFPEWVRLAALAGAEILAAPTNWPIDTPREMPTPMSVVRVQADASVNKMVVIAADRSGAERGVDWVGGSCIVTAEGVLLAGPPSAAEPAILVAEVDLTTTRNKQTGPRNDPMRDRRPELYGAVASPAA
jgi:5-aminopentanamidase